MIPFLLLFASGVAAMEGIIEGIEGMEKISKAKEIVEDNKRLYKKEYRRTQNAVESLQQDFETVGKVKLELQELRKEVVIFLKGIMNNVKARKITPKEEKLLLDLNSFVNETQKKIDYTDEIISGIMKSAGASFLSYVGAIGIATSIGTASTGTAIASLSGAAAENAILAWFGGGSLAAGGGGMALGSLVLSGIVAGPTIFFAGFSLSKAGEKALTQAKEFESNVKKEVKKMEILRGEIKETSEWLYLYCEVCEILKNKINSLMSSIKLTEIDKDKIVCLILLTRKIAELLEINPVERNSFRLTKEAKRLIERHRKELRKIVVNGE